MLGRRISLLEKNGLDLRVMRGSFYTSRGYAEERKEIGLILVVFTFFFRVLEPVDELLHLFHEYRPAPLE